MKVITNPSSSSKLLYCVAFLCASHVGRHETNAIYIYLRTHVVIEVVFDSATAVVG